MKQTTTRMAPWALACATLALAGCGALKGHEQRDPPGGAVRIQSENGLNKPQLLRACAVGATCDLKISFERVPTSPKEDCGIRVDYPVVLVSDRPDGTRASVTWRIDPKGPGGRFTLRGPKGEPPIATYLTQKDQDDLFGVTVSEDGKAAKLVFKSTNKRRESAGYAYSVTAWYMDANTKQMVACPVHDPIIIDHG